MEDSKLHLSILFSKISFIAKFLFISSLLLFSPALLFASQPGDLSSVGGIRVEFILFALTLIGVAIFHNKTLYITMIGLISILVFKFIFAPDFSLFRHIMSSPSKEGEWKTLVNLMGLLFGFAILAKHFEESEVPNVLPNYLPNGWKGCMALLFVIMFISSFLDNIAAAMIGGSIALVVFKGKVHIGYLAAIVAASNAGGAGSVIGDTTTTLMWIDGVNPLDVTHAFIGSLAAFAIFGIAGSIQQDRYQPIQKEATPGASVQWGKLLIVVLILVAAIVANYTLNFPAVGAWSAILVSAFFLKTPWGELKKSWQGTFFILALVISASLMPVEELRKASWISAFLLGFVSSVFDNIPLTKLCLEQGGYDWGILAFSVGFGGSMIWFGSSAGVALSNKFPETRSVVSYIRYGWHVIIAYLVSFFIMLVIAGWHPHAPHRKLFETDKKIEKLAFPRHDDRNIRIDWN